MAMKRPYQPSKRRRQKKLGFRARTKTKSGKKIVKLRRLKGRARLTL